MRLFEMHTKQQGCKWFATRHLGRLRKTRSILGRIIPLTSDSNTWLGLGFDSVNGFTLCIHNKQKYVSKEYGGKGICRYGMSQYYDKRCCGKGLCLHNKVKSAYEPKWPIRPELISVSIALSD